MAEIAIDKLSDYAYNLLPNIYRQMDVQQNKDRPPLYLYMRSMFCGADVTNEGDSTHITGAGEILLNKMNDFTRLMNPDSCPDEIFPCLFESFGLTYNDSIEIRQDTNGNKIIYYHRKFLNNLGELIKRLGTIAGIRYLVRVLTGLEFEYEYYRGFNEDGNFGRYLKIYLKAKSVEEINSIPHSIKVIENFLKPFVPFYINSVTFGEAVIDVQYVVGKSAIISTSLQHMEQTIHD